MHRGFLVRTNCNWQLKLGPRLIPEMLSPIHDLSGTAGTGPDQHEFGDSRLQDRRGRGKCANWFCPLRDSCVPTLLSAVFTSTGLVESRQLPRGCLSEVGTCATKAFDRTSCNPLGQIERALLRLAGALWRLALRLLCRCMLVELLPSRWTARELC